MAKEEKYLVKYMQPVHRRMNKFQYNTTLLPNCLMKTEMQEGK